LDKVKSNQYDTTVYQRELSFGQAYCVFGRLQTARKNCIKIKYLQMKKVGEHSTATAPHQPALFL